LNSSQELAVLRATPDRNERRDDDSCHAARLYNFQSLLGAAFYIKTCRTVNLFRELRFGSLLRARRVAARRQRFVEGRAS
jgi:hypothetical protein